MDDLSQPNLTPEGEEYLRSLKERLEAGSARWKLGPFEWWWRRQKNGRLIVFAWRWGRR